MSDNYDLARSEVVYLVHQAMDLMETANAVWVAYGFTGNRAGKCHAETVLFHLLMELGGITNDGLSMADERDELSKINTRLRPIEEVAS